jgi:septum site-determining protein MinC
MAKPQVKFSGTDTGLLMRLEWGAPLSQLLDELEAHLRQSPAFFDGAQVILEIGHNSVPLLDIEQLAKTLLQYGVTLQGVVPTLDSQDRRPSTTPQPVAAAPLFDPHTSVHLEHRTLRSGEKIAYEGHVIILGDVNPGAEVTAGYNIFVWGSLKGSAYAGMPNYEEAIIAALHLAPIQLRIAEYIARAPEVQPATVWVPEKARIDQNAIVVETWERGQASLKRG